MKNKKLLLMTILLLMFPILVNATTIAKDDVTPMTHIIGKYMFTSDFDALTTKKYCWQQDHLMEQKNQIL